jgi:hypothetical protein
MVTGAPEPRRIWRSAHACDVSGVQNLRDGHDSHHGGLRRIVVTTARHSGLPSAISGLPSVIPANAGIQIPDWAPAPD